jgi:transcriptional regulator with XRE-family HTH domain
MSNDVQDGPTPGTLGERLRRVRTMRGLSLREAAERARISPAYLQKLERGQVQSPSPNHLYKLAKELKVSYSDLMKLAGYVVPRGSSQRTALGGGMLAHALSSEELTEQEADALANYLAWYRSEQRSGRG